MDDAPAPQNRPDKAARRAAALRANLARRKAQKRARGADEDSAVAGADENKAAAEAAEQER